MTRQGILVAIVVTAAWFRVAPLDAQQSGECFVFARLGADAPLISDPAECGVKTAPASTFKIPHALIALQAGVSTADEVFRWDGAERSFDSWRTDHTLDSAIKWSVLPFFQRTAALLGRERMSEGLASLNYASDTFDGDLSTFWLNGDLVVSPLEQFSFLQRLFSGSLPVANSHLSAVQNALRMPTGEILLAAGARPFALDWPAATIVRAKTGNTRVNGERVSWLVGGLQVDGARYLFVARARSTDPLEPTAGAEVARRGLNKVAALSATGRARSETEAPHDVNVETATCSLVDPTRNRSIPVAIYKTGPSHVGKAKLAIISHGYGGKNTDYSFIATYLATHGYYVASIQHEIPGDEPLPTSGNPYDTRKPSWERGVQDILFVIGELRKTRPDLDYERLLLVGHSHGGDTSMLFAHQHPDLVHTVISLDNRRMPFPRTGQPRILSIRSSDQQADEGVIPSPREQAALGIKVVTLPATIHNAMWDGGTTEQKDEIIRQIDAFRRGKD